MSESGGTRAVVASRITMKFGGVTALGEVDLMIHSGEVLGLIGPNGAGKSTMVNVLSGFSRPTSGTVTINGEDITGVAPARIARKGLCRAFQGSHTFENLTVQQSVEVGAVATGAKPSVARERAAELIELVGLTDVRGEFAGILTQGGERRLAVARALSTGAEFVLLDEPAAGLTEEETGELGESLLALHRQRKQTMLMIDHDVSFIMGLCSRVQVLDKGTTLAVGTPAEIRADPAVIEAYLG